MLSRDPTTPAVLAEMFSARAKWIVVAVAVVLPLAYALFTDHAWEDYFITLRSSRNLVEGRGLVFNPGQRVHTFTSPLGVLTPALCTWLVGPNHEAAALWLFRAINLALLGSVAALLWRRVDALGLGAVGRVTLFGLLFTDAKLVDFSINGMETAILVYFLVLLWSELEAEAPRVGVLAVAIGGLMWTRPDAFILGGALLIAHVAIRGRDGPARIAWRPLVRGVLLGGLLYLPWFAWARWYYGTPVPHTVTAKGAFTPPFVLKNLLLYPGQTLLGRSMLVDLFLPTYWPFGGWPTLLPRVSGALAGIAAFVWVVPAFPGAARRASLAVFFGLFYVNSIVLFPWYVPPWTALAAIALGFATDALFHGLNLAKRRTLALALRVGVVGLVALQLVVLVASAWQMRAEQTYVENGVRRRIGEYLRQHAARDDTVFLEPLGYIGYFSQLKTYDFPGLSSPEVVAAIRSGAHRYAEVIARLHPAWVVLRPHEFARPEFARTGVLRDYDLVRSWDARPQLDQIALLPGRPWVEGEAQFLLFKRKSGP